VIDVRVRQQNVFHGKLLPGHNVQQLAHFVSRIDQDCFPRARAAHDETVFLKGGNRPDFD
jgi:hypothetical protein